MILFKALFLFNALQAELPAEVNSSDWVAVERQEKDSTPAGADESDPSIWVVFAKTIGSEKFLVSFPVEPGYKYTQNDGSAMQISASAGASNHHVEVFGPSSDLLSYRKAVLQGGIIVLEKSDEAGSDLIYWKDGYWYMERLISTGVHSYILQTKNADLESESHQMFVSSFDHEKK